MKSHNRKIINPGQGLKEGTTSQGNNQAAAAPPEVRGTWYNSHNGTSFTISIYENELHVSSPTYSKSESPPPKREEGDIQRFSKKSRLRILQKFNRLQAKALSAPIFVSLTARHSSMSEKAFCEKFKKQMLPNLKKIIPNLVYSWRLEAHADGFPHIHMFCWSWDKERNLGSRYYKDQIRDAWCNIINDNSAAARRYAMQVSPIKSHRNAMAYVSKYMAKVDEEEEKALEGRRWGQSTDFPDDPITEIKLTHEKYLQFKKIAKRLLCNKGGYYEKQSQYLDGSGDFFLWMSLDEIISFLSQVPGISLPSEVEFYNETGSTDPPDSFFEKYADYL